MGESSSAGGTVDARWITERLRRSGVLSRGRVTGIRPRTNDASNAVVTHLEVRYSEEAPDDAPRALLLKRTAAFAGEREIAFYREAPRLPMLLECYDTDLDAVTGDAHLLIRDVSETHKAPVSREQLLAGDGVPARPALDAIMDELARFHAHWWDDTRLGGDGIFGGRWYADRDMHAQHVRRRHNEWAAFSNSARDHAVEVGAVYEEALAVISRAWEAHLAPRLHRRRNLTLTHGDCYLTQWLCSTGDAGQTYLIDFDSVSANLPAFDLAYLLPTFWTPEQRRRLESSCLRRYHEGLRAEGIEGHGWNDLVTDYRWMIAFMLFDPVFDQTNGSSEAYWMPKMGNLVAAYRDWGCSSLGLGG